jgi:cytochrome P450
MTSLPSDPLPYPFERAGALDLPEGYAAVQSTTGMIRVQLAQGEPAWLVTRYADARFVLGDRRFNRLPPADRHEPRSYDSDGVLTDGVFTKDAPDHTRLRTLVTKAFTTRRVEVLRPRIRELAQGFLDRMVELGSPADLVDRYALPVPAAVICELLGVPAGDRGRFRELSDSVLSTNTLSAAETSRSQGELRDYMAELIRMHRAGPTDDLITALIEARDVGDRLSEAELVDLCVGILVAGYETTASQIPNIMYVLLENPERLAELQADPGLIPAAVEELMRYIPFTGADFPRYPTEDIELGGELIRAGEPVLVAVSAANRDALRYESPDEIRFDRPDNHLHLGFGHGMHHCLGAQLARVELQEALEVLITRLPGVKLAGDVRWKTDMIMRGPQAMPVRW